MLGKEKREMSYGRACQGEEETRFKKGAASGFDVSDQLPHFAC